MSLFHPRILALRRYYSNFAREPVIQILKADINQFGFNRNAAPIFRDVEWTVNDGENWAIIGKGVGGEKSALFQALSGHLRISPLPPSGLFPFLLARNLDHHTHVSLVSFSNRPRSHGGAFYDYTARYGAVREEDRITLMQNMFPEMIQPDFKLGFNPLGEDSEKIENIDAETRVYFEELVGKLNLKDLLDLPLVALSNGQTRRARIVKALLAKPELLLLDEPLTGLDVSARPALLNLLHSLHSARAPRVVLGLRRHDPIPEWITHVAIVGQGKIQAGLKETLENELNVAEAHNPSPLPSPHKMGPGELVVEMKDVNVAYHDRKVLKSINWEIRQGERWHLQGANGSGKTTLTSLLTGDHPQSYTNPHLHLFGRPRSRTATPILASLIGLVSPEVFNAFPRRANMTIRDAIGTGFDGGFVPLGTERVGLGVSGPLSPDDIKWRVKRVDEVLRALGPWSWGRENDNVKGWSERSFVDLAPGEQSMVLLMRAIVGRPKLVLLDEVWSGMDERMIEAARVYLRGDGLTAEQAVVVISHWEEEVPWTSADGVKRFKLDHGCGSIVL